MEISEEQMDELEAALGRLETVDPASLPEPAAELAEVLGRILDSMETN